MISVQIVVRLRLVTLLVALFTTGIRRVIFATRLWHVCCTAAAIIPPGASHLTDGIGRSGPAASTPEAPDIPAAGSLHQRYRLNELEAQACWVISVVGVSRLCFEIHLVADGVSGKSVAQGFVKTVSISLNASR